jgi:hypothetical protein
MLSSSTLLKVKWLSEGKAIVLNVKLDLLIRAIAK